MNKKLIAPVAAILVLIGKELLDIDISNEDMETALNVALMAIGGIGAFIKPKKDDTK